MIYDYSCSLSFTKEDELIHMLSRHSTQNLNLIMLVGKLLDELKLNEETVEDLDEWSEDLDEWFEERCCRTGRVFDINVYTFYPKDELAVVMYECFEDEQGLWSTDISKQLSFKLKLTDYINRYKGI
jgi:hypothetical protein